MGRGVQCCCRIPDGCWTTTRVQIVHVVYECTHPEHTNLGEEGIDEERLIL